MEKGRAYRDGLHDATLFEDAFESGVIKMIEHGLGRVVNQVVVVKSDRAIKNPEIAQDVSHNEINDANQIGLKFDDGPATVRLRFC
jgi:hypothetical protein